MINVTLSTLRPLTRPALLAAGALAAALMLPGGATAQQGQGRGNQPPPPPPTLGLDQGQIPLIGCKLQEADAALLKVQRGFCLPKSKV
jgi:hypothetical protein